VFLLCCRCAVQVYRGTWKHTDIAAKEYLPIEPAQEAQSSRQDSPSDAAMAHARAALAKEVHWLTSLNHPNLVRFCAVCLERPLVVMEFYKHGSVFAMLQKAARELARSQQARLKGVSNYPCPRLCSRWFGNSCSSIAQHSTSSWTAAVPSSRNVWHSCLSWAGCRTIALQPARS
jgi:hypothetical protein